MHRTGPSTVERSSAMQTFGAEPIELALSPAGRVGGELGVDAADRRAIPEGALLRREEDGQDVRHQSRPRRTAAAADGPGSDLPQAATVAEHDGTPDLPLFVAEFEGRAAEPGVGQRHHLRAHAAGLDVLDGGHGLVQSLRAVVAVVEHFGRTVLPGGVGGGVARLRRKSSTPTRGCNTRQKRLRVAWRRRACG